MNKKILFASSGIVKVMLLLSFIFSLAASPAAFLMNLNYSLGIASFVILWVVIIAYITFTIYIMKNEKIKNKIQDIKIAWIIVAIYFLLSTLIFTLSGVAITSN